MKQVQPPPPPPTPNVNSTIGTCMFRKNMFYFLFFIFHAVAKSYCTKRLAESQKGVNAVQRCSVENQKGVIAIELVQ